MNGFEVVPLLRAAMPYDAPQGKEPAMPILWSWIPLGDDAAVRKPWRIALLSVLGLIAVVQGSRWFLDGLDPDCVTRICQRRTITAPIVAVGGLITLVFPWLNLRWRTYLTGRYELTATHFRKTMIGKTDSFPLQGGRIVIRYNIANFEPLHGFRKRLTPIMPSGEAKRLFSAVQQARALSSAQEPQS